jgi:predicted metal-dependent hydrolase
MVSKSLLKPEKELTTKLSDFAANSLVFKGKQVELDLQPSPFGFSRLFFSDRTLTLKLPSTLSADEINEFSKKQIENWLKSQARKTINQAVYCLCDKHNLSYNNVVIKDTRSRWGSCSGRKNLNFNWRLILAPEEVLNYVVVHETAHLQEMNHSGNFWKLVQERCPDYDLHRNWLKKNGASLLNWRLKL